MLTGHLLKAHESTSTCTSRAGTIVLTHLSSVQEYDAVLMQGPSATTLADHVAYANVSAVRFVGVRESGINDDISPLYERPELIVLGSNTRSPLPKEPSLWFTPHMELPVGVVHDYRAPHYKELVQRIWVRLFHFYDHKGSRQI